MIRRLTRSWRSRLQERAEGSDRGITLVELMVSMSIFTVVMLVVSTVVINSTAMSNKVSSATKANADARIAAEGMSRYIRVANAPRGMSSPFMEVKDDSMTFFAQLEFDSTSAQVGDPTLVKIYMSGNEILAMLTDVTIRRTPDRNGNYFELGASNKLRLGESTAGQPISFQYYDDARLIDDSITVRPLSFDTSGKVPAAEWPRIVAVQVGVMVKDTASGVTKDENTYIKIADRVVLNNVLARK